jgi:hypothetical protein
VVCATRPSGQTMANRCELCAGPVEPGEWRRCRRCRLDYGIAQHKPGERLYQT